MSVTTTQLAAATPFEQKQMLGEVLYMRIAPYVPGFYPTMTLLPLEPTRPL
jgi:hypothetical protein